jgi:hypothetical protein
VYYYPISEATNFPLYYDAQNKEIYMECYSKRSGENPDYHYRNSIEAAFSLAADTFRLLSQTFPQSYIGHYYGVANQISRCVNKGKHIYSFTIEPSLFVLDIATGKKEIFKGRSNFHKKDAEPIPYKEIQDEDYNDLIVRKMTEYPLYLNVFYDKYQKVYYRTLLADQELENKDGSFNAFRDKTYVLMAYDENFKLIGEKKVGENKFGPPFFITPQGLLAIKKVEKDKLKLSLIKLTRRL